ncbi:hypothetical protein OH686_07170 [Pseudomonas sp. SO81]|nr:hypothetical protein OH686_07170 [Pseudomonas sp. SO81]
MVEAQAPQKILSKRMNSHLSKAAGQARKTHGQGGKPEEGLSDRPTATSRGRSGAGGWRRWRAGPASAGRGDRWWRTRMLAVQGGEAGAGEREVIHRRASVEGCADTNPAYPVGQH